MNYLGNISRSQDFPVYSITGADSLETAPLFFARTGVDQKAGRLIPSTGEDRSV